MKNLILFFAGFLLPMLAIGQNGKPLSGDQGAPKALTNVSLLTTSDYTPGQANLIPFTLSFSSPDFEYADGFEMTFPQGVTPQQSGSSSVIGDIESEISLNLPVSGQTISWGTIPGGSQFGDLYPGTYQFEVNVQVEASFTGSMLVTFALHGDTYGGEPHLVSGTLIILAQNAPRLPHNPNPANFQTNVELDGTLTWNFGNNTQTYDLWFGPEGEMTQVVSGASAGASGSWSFSGLAQNAIYQWQVIAHNSAKLITTGPVWNFFTIAGAIDQYPYLQNFDGTWIGAPAAPIGWTVINADQDEFTWTQANTYIEPTPSPPYAAHGMGNQDDWLISPAFDLSSALVVLNWFDKVEGATRVNSYKVLVSTTTPAISSFTYELADIVCDNTEWTGHSLSLEEFTGQTIFIAFHQYFSSNANWGFGIDDVGLEAQQGCPVPADLSVPWVTFESAMLEWSGQGSEISWNLEWGPGDFSQGNGTQVNGLVSNEYLLLNLEPETTYAFYVQAVCGEGLTSGWAGPFSFTTLPGSTELSCPGDMAACEADPPFALTGATPSGGVYAGPGVADGIFSPETAGPGNHVLTYTVGEEFCSFSITVAEALQVSVSISSDLSEVCQGSPVNFSAVAVNGGVAPFFQWKVNGQNTGTNDPQFSYVPADGDEVWVVLTSSEDCTNENPATSNVLEVTVNENPVVDWEWEYTTVCLQVASIPLTGGSPPGGTYGGTGVEGDLFLPPTAGVGTHTLTYSFTSPEGCSASATVEIIVDACTGITGPETPGGPSVYPNPATTLLTLKIPDVKPAYGSFHILDVNGKEVLSIDLDPSETLRVIDVSHLPRGIYFYQVKGPKTSFAGRIAFI